jgi:hypothetical protein
MRKRENDLLLRFQNTSSTNSKIKEVNVKKSVLTLGMAVLLFLSPMLLQAQEKSLMISSADFVPHQNDNGIWRNAEYFYTQTGATHRYFYAPIDLPDGVRLKRVVLFFHDSGTGYVQLTVYRNNKYTGGQDYVVSSTSSSGTPGDSSLSAGANWAYNLISNNGYSYSLRIYFSEAGSAYKFIGARVVYQ